jgi:hypothetical protein
MWKWSERLCRKCNVMKPISEFHPHKYGKRHECKDCQYFRSTLTKYKISKEDYESLNKGYCTICKRTKNRLCVDHNHLTGQVRGLVCHNCNSYLGVIERDPTVLERIKDYLCLPGPS